jgi:hypothetical protein
MRKMRPIRRGVILWAAFAVLAAALVLETRGVAGAADATQSARGGDEKRLIGRWVRLDGGYILELSGIGKDGSLKASYFNPRAGFTRTGGRLTVFIELRDINYPGSTYNLQYDSGSDRLKGTYFQAVEKQTFEVEFVRAR